MKYSINLFAGMQDVGAGDLLSDKAILEALTNTANTHAQSIGQGTADEFHDSLAWVVLNWKIKVYRRPKVCEYYKSTTWGRKYLRSYCWRDFEMRDSGGEVFA